METTFDQIDTVDHYYEALRTMLDNRIAGKEIQTVTPEAKTTKVVDIMDALRASLKLNATEAEASTAESAAIETQQSTAQPQLTLVSPAKETQRTRKRRAESNNKSEFQFIRRAVASFSNAIRAGDFVYLSGVARTLRRGQVQSTIQDFQIA